MGEHLSSSGCDDGLMIEVRALPADRLSVITEIDRSEPVDTIFEVRAGDLTSRSVDLDVPRWSSQDKGPHSVSGFIDDLRPILDRGAALLAAYDQDAVAGVAIVEEHFERSPSASICMFQVTNDDNLLVQVDGDDRVCGDGGRGGQVPDSESAGQLVRSVPGDGIS
jgi:hypothetical protein